MSRAERLAEETSDNVKKVIDKALEAQQRDIDRDMRSIDDDISRASSCGNMKTVLDVKNESVRPIVTRLENEGFYVTVSPKLAGDGPFTKPYETTLKVSWKPKDIVKLRNDSTVKRWIRHHSYISALNIGVGIFYFMVGFIVSAFSVIMISAILC